PFLIRAAGSTGRIETAFRTRLSTYRDPRGVEYFANSSAVRLPAAISGGVLGVIGLTNTVREHAGAVPVRTTRRPVRTTRRPAGRGSADSQASCETPYVTRAELFASVSGTSFPYGFGGGPACSGMTPAQDNSIYDAPHVGPRGRGAGVTAAVFELSAYLPSDIDTWARTLYGSGYTPPLADDIVDGGPLSPQCPAGDTCPPDINGYASDFEVNGDIELELSIAPDLRHLIVYNAPNDFTGQTELDEYTAMASDDTAATISSSYSACENDVTAAYVRSENVVFEQMALQGQSVFNDNQDDGAFGCIRSDGTDIVDVQDPSSQPWVTSVGGTSLESDNPGTSPHPAYPHGTETAWNTEPAPGWFMIGGTSMSTPLWAATTADRDSFAGLRTGNVNPLLYLLFNTAPGRYFHDITGVGPAQQAATTNGLFPTTQGYDLATGIGTPEMTALITSSGT
ncbi:MAG: S53 family peptidase, partial [Streptosporangiaceae bacterium]